MTFRLRMKAAPLKLLDRAGGFGERSCSPFRLRMKAAPLKPRDLVGRVKFFRPFRLRMKAAPLKHAASRQGQLPQVPFRLRMKAAPLKHVGAARVVAKELADFPPSNEGGPVEARVCSAWTCAPRRTAFP